MTTDTYHSQGYSLVGPLESPRSSLHRGEGQSGRESSWEVSGNERGDPLRDHPVESGPWSLRRGRVSYVHGGVVRVTSLGPSGTDGGEVRW